MNIRCWRAWLARAGVVVAAVVLAVVVAGGSVSAHATLVSSSPAAESVLDSAPAQIVLTFDEKVDLEPQSIRLVTGSGTDVAIGVPAHQGSSTVVATVPSLKDGTYVVAWRVISADSHPVSGAFTFSVRAQTATAPGLVSRLLAASHPSTAIERVLGVGRWLSYAGLALLLGPLVMLAVCDPQALRSRRAALLVVGGCMIGVIGTAWMIVAQASLQTGHPWSLDGWRAVADTQAGRWWAIRLGLFVVGGALAPLAKRMRVDNASGPLVAVYSAALLAVVTAGGHGVTGRWVSVGFAATMIHLAAMSLWLGGLVALLVVVPRADRWRAAGRFSRVALLSVMTLAATGFLNAWRQAGSLSALVGSNYGIWLFVKLGVVVTVLVAASFSRRIVLGSVAPYPSSRRLGRLIAGELVGIVVVLGATAGLVSSAPPRTTTTAPESANVVVANRITQVVLDPPVTGGTTMHIYVSSYSGSLDQPTKITVTASLPAKGITDLVLPVEDAGPGHVTSSDAVFPVAGTWTVAVTARYSEFDQTIFDLPLVVH
jgi:copper transport protein